MKTAYLILCLAFYYANTANAVNEHQETPSPITKIRMQSEQPVSLLSIENLLSQIILLEKSVDGRVLLTMIQNETADKAKDDIIRLFGNTNIWDYIQNTMENEAKLKILNKKTGMYTDDKIASLGSLLAFALSSEDLNNKNKQRLYLSNDKSELMSVDATYRKPEDIKQVKGVLIELEKYRTVNATSEKFNVVLKPKNLRPADLLLQYTADKTYKRVDQTEAVRKWQADRVIFELYSEPKLQEQVKLQENAHLSGVHSFDEESIFQNEEVQKLWEKYNIPIEARKELKDRVTALAVSRLQDKINPNSLSNVAIEKTPLQLNKNFLPKGADNVKRVAIIDTSDNLKERTNAAKQAGAKILYTSDPFKALSFIEDEYEPGKEYHVIFAAHGYGGKLEKFFYPGNESNRIWSERLLCETAKIDKVYLMGCSVAKNLNSFHHAQRELAQRLGVPVYAVDQTLMTGYPGGYFIQKPGNLVEVTPRSE